MVEDRKVSSGSSFFSESDRHICVPNTVAKKLRETSNERFAFFIAGNSTPVLKSKNVPQGQSWHTDPASRDI